MINLIKRFWKWLIGLFVVGVVLAGGLQIIDTPNRTLEQQILQTIEMVQMNFYQTHGQYFQGFPTSKAVPISTSTSDNLDTKPFYQAEKWSDFITLPQLPFQITIHQYKAPKGDGYQVFFTDVKGTRSYGYGVEAESRTYEFIAPEIINDLTPTTTPK